MNWAPVSLGQLCKFQAGGAFPTSYQGHSFGDFPFVKVSDFSLPANGVYLKQANNWVSESVTGELRGRPVPSESVVFAKIGEALKSERLRIAVRPTLMDNNLMAAVPIDGCVNPRFLFYLLETVHLKKWAEGSALPYLRQKDLEVILVVVPDLPEQGRIADLLKLLDDKIDCIRRVVDLIPQLLEAIIESHIEPNGEEVSVSSLGRFVNGGAYTNGATGQGRMVIRIAELNSGPGPSTVYNELIVPDDQLARAGDILMAWSGSLGVYRWTREEAVINQHIFKVIPDTLPLWLVHDRLARALPIFKGIAKDKATTMGHIKRHHLDETTVRIPSSQTIIELTPEADLLWQRLLAAEAEIHLLIGMRKALLPELLSGRVRVDTCVSCVEDDL